MKKLFLLLVACLSTAFTFAQTESIEFEPRVGISMLTAYERQGVDLGYNLGGMVAFPITEKFYINPGMTFFSTSSGGEHVGILQIPVYASYRVPMGKTCLRLNAGPYAQLGEVYDFGLSAEVGLEYKRWYGAVNAYQNLLIDEMSGFFGLSFGYKFRLE